MIGTRKSIFYLDEYLDEKTTEQHAAEIRRLMEKWDIDYIYIDSRLSKLGLTLLKIMIYPPLMPKSLFWTASAMWLVLLIIII